MSFWVWVCDFDAHTQVDEAPFHTQRLLVARTNAMYPASQCWGLGGRGDVFCIVHPEVYGKRQALLPVRTINQCFLGGCDDPVINYAWNDPMFDRFNVTPVGPPPAEPAVPYGVNSQGKPGGCMGYIGGPINSPVCTAWRNDYATWNSNYQTSLDALSIPLNAYNAVVNEDNRLHKFEDYTWYELTGTPSRTQVTNSSPALLRVGGDLTIKGNGAGTDAQILEMSKQASSQGWTLYQKTGQLPERNSMNITIDSIPFKVNFAKDQFGNISIYSHPGKE